MPAQAGGEQALPHIGVRNIAALDWGALRKAGFKGCVFDKDNTLTEPYAHVVAPQLADSLADCKRQFDNQVVIYSNSAGLREFDPDGMPHLNVFYTRTCSLVPPWRAARMASCVSRDGLCLAVTLGMNHEYAACIAASRPPRHGQHCHQAALL